MKFKTGPFLLFFFCFFFCCLLFVFPLNVKQNQLMKSECFHIIVVNNINAKIQ